MYTVVCVKSVNVWNVSICLEKHIRNLIQLFFWCDNNIIFKITRNWLVLFLFILIIIDKLYVCVMCVNYVAILFDSENIKSRRWRFFAICIGLLKVSKWYWIPQLWCPIISEYILFKCIYIWTGQSHSTFHFISHMDKVNRIIYRFWLDTFKGRVVIHAHTSFSLFVLTL